MHGVICSLTAIKLFTGAIITSRYVDSGRSRDDPVSGPAAAPSVSSFEAEAAAAAMPGRASAGRDASSCRCTPGSLSDSSGASSAADSVLVPSPLPRDLLALSLLLLPLFIPLLVLLARH